VVWERSSRVPFDEKGNPPGLDRAAVTSEREKNKTHWNSKKQQNYNFIFELDPFAAIRPESERGPFRVTVKKGLVSKVVYAATGDSVDEQNYHNVPTIEGLFDLIAKQLNEDIEGIVVDYDESYGFPKKIIISYLPLGKIGRERITMIYISDMHLPGGDVSINNDQKPRIFE